MLNPERTVRDCGWRVYVSSHAAQRAVHRCPQLTSHGRIVRAVKGSRFVSPNRTKTLRKSGLDLRRLKCGYLAVWNQDEGLVFILAQKSRRVFIVVTVHEIPERHPLHEAEKAGGCDGSTDE